MLFSLLKLSAERRLQDKWDQALKFFRSIRFRRWIFALIELRPIQSWHTQDDLGAYRLWIHQEWICPRTILKRLTQSAFGIRNSVCAHIRWLFKFVGSSWYGDFTLNWKIYVQMWNVNTPEMFISQKHKCTIYFLTRVKCDIKWTKLFLLFCLNLSYLARIIFALPSFS